MRYRITLAHDEPGRPMAQRWVNRKNTAEATDSAVRWLRLSRNTTPKAMDRFTRYVIEAPTAGESYRTIAVGRFDD